MLTKEQKRRYSRQILSSSIGEEGQEKISKIRVLQIGAGGLGSPCGLYLVAAGIGEITIVDNDVVDLSNLQRQILYKEEHQGEIKVDKAKEVLSQLNSEVKINAHRAYVDENSIETFLDGQDFIIDCSDNLQTKFLVNSTAVKHGMKCVIAGIEDFFGQVMTINPKETACYECVFNQPESFKKRDTPLPTIGVTPGILGTLEASEVIKTCLGLNNLYDHLLMVDLLRLTFNKISVKKNENCACSI